MQSALKCTGATRSAAWTGRKWGTGLLTILQTVYPQACRIFKLVLVRLGCIILGRIEYFDENGGSMFGDRVLAPRRTCTSHLSTSIFMKEIFFASYRAISSSSR